MRKINAFSPYYPFIFVTFAKILRIMTQNNGKTDSLWKAFLYRLIIFLCTVGLIVYFMPRDVKFNYQFDLDKPWKYGQLIATFDFPIYKSDEVVKREQDSILKRFQPYYILDKDVSKQELAQLRADYQETLKELLPNNDYYTHLQRARRQHWGNYGCG